MLVLNPLGSASADNRKQTYSIIGSVQIAQSKPRQCTWDLVLLLVDSIAEEMHTNAIAV